MTSKSAQRFAIMNRKQSHYFHGREFAGVSLIWVPADKPRLANRFTYEDARAKTYDLGGPLECRIIEFGSD